MLSPHLSHDLVVVVVVTAPGSQWGASCWRRTSVTIRAEDLCTILAQAKVTPVFV